MTRTYWLFLLTLIVCSCTEQTTESTPESPTSSLAAPTPTLEPIRAPEPPFHLTDTEWDLVQGILLVEFNELDQMTVEIEEKFVEDDKTTPLDGSIDIAGKMILAGGVVRNFKTLQDAILNSSSDFVSHICKRHVRQNPAPTVQRDEYNVNNLLQTLDRIRLGQFYLVKAGIAKSGQVVALLKIGGEHWLFFIASKLSNHTDSLYRPAGDLREYAQHVFSGFKPVNRREYLPIIKFAAGCYRKTVQQQLDAGTLQIIDPIMVKPEVQVLWPGAAIASPYVAGSSVNPPTVANQYDAVSLFESTTYRARIPTVLDGQVTYFEFEAEKYDALTGTEILLLAVVSPIVVYTVSGFVVTATAGLATYATASQAFAAGATVTPILVPLATAP